MSNVARHITSIETKGFACGGCMICTESEAGDAFAESRMELFELGIVLCNGIGTVPGGGRPLAELAGWECARLMRMGLDAVDALVGARKLIAQTAPLVGSGWSTVMAARFLSDGMIDVCFSGDTLGFVVGLGPAKPLGRVREGDGAERMPRDGALDRNAYQSRLVSLEPGEWFCAMSGNAWRGIPLASIAQTCRDNAGDPTGAASDLADTAICYGSGDDVTIAVAQRL